MPYIKLSVKNTDFLVHLNGKGRRAPFHFVKNNFYDFTQELQQDELSKVSLFFIQSWHLSCIFPF